MKQTSYIQRHKRQYYAGKNNDMDIDENVSVNGTTKFIRQKRHRPENISYDNSDNVAHSSAWLMGNFFNINKSYMPHKLSDFSAHKIVIGEQHAALITQSNDVYIRGINSPGKLGIMNNGLTNATIEDFTLIPNIKARQVACANFGTMLLDMDDNVLIDKFLTPKRQRGNPYKFYVVPGVSARQIACGSTHYAFIDYKYRVWIWVCNRKGQLGFGDNKDRYSPTKLPKIRAKYISCGPENTGIIGLDNEVWVFGKNNYGQLGLGDTKHRLSPTKIDNFKAKRLAMGKLHSLATDTNRHLWGFGSNMFGQLGLGDYKSSYSPTKLLNLKITQIVPIYTMSVVLDEHNNLWMCGNCRDIITGIDFNKKKNFLLFQKFQHFKVKFVSGGLDDNLGFIAKSTCPLNMLMSPDF